MRNVRFSIFNAEEFDDTLEDTSAAGETETVAEQIQAECDEAELDETTETVENVMASTEEAEEVVEELEEQKEDAEKAIEENPEAVTDDTVAVAQEQFYITISRVAGLAEYRRFSNISHELSASTPMERLKLTCEGIGEFISALIAKIKLAYLKIKELFRKLYAKILVVITNVKARADKLKNFLQNLTSSNKAAFSTDFGKSALEDKTVETISNYFKCFLASGMVKSVKDLDQIVLYFSKSYNNCQAFIKNVESYVNSTGAKNISSVNDEMTKLACSKETNAIYAPFFVRSTLRALVVNPNSKDDEDISVEYKDISIDASGKIENTIPKKEELIASLQSLSIRGNRQVNDVIGVAQKLQDRLYKYLDKVEEEQRKNVDKFVDRMNIKNKLRLVRRAGTSVLVDFAISIISNYRNLLTAYSLVIKDATTTATFKLDEDKK